jgi:uncharacterized membrane protein YfcA
VSSAELALIVVGAVVAGFVQGLSGFGFSMVSMSIWIWGLSPQLAAVLAVFGSLVGQVVGVFSVRRGLSLAALLPFLAGGLLGIPLGVALLPRLDAHLFKLVVGMLLVTLCPLMIFADHFPRIALRHSLASRAADALAGLGGGFMGGIGGATGVIPTLWCTLRGLPKAAQRAVIQNFNLATLSVTMTAYIATGAVTRPMWPLLPLVAVALVVPSLIGARLYRGLSDQGFRRVVLGLLTLAGAVMLASALPKLLR